MDSGICLFSRSRYQSVIFLSSIPQLNVVHVFYRERRQKIEDIKKNIRDAILVSTRLITLFTLASFIRFCL